ncbi:MAG: endonuclease [Paludibacteraceae bacterium]|nr:endonuclease [Paludibacteraceae bacterium]
MKKIFPILFSFCFSIGMMAETYTIVFKSGNGAGDSGSKISDLSKIVLSATDNCVESVVQANNIYNAGSGKGIKGGTGSAKGELTLGLNATYQITSLTVFAASYTNKSDTTNGKGIIVCDETTEWRKGNKMDILPYTVKLNKALNTISIAATTDKNNRWYLQKIVFEAPDPQPLKAQLGTPFNLDFGSVPIEEGETTEDVVSVNITGKHVDGAIQLSLSTGKVFSLGSNTLPAEGGELAIIYRLNYSGTANDNLTISAKGLDGKTTNISLPIKLSGYKYTPPSIDVDSSCMAIGPMPSLYYEPAQGTQDSVLKSRLGAIIICGVRLRYGSGTLHTWDGFYKTDRDTMTNQVLDMYSNEVRYFDSERPAAAVANFDIEHMLPKSWWGRTVNGAYCDLFHLVPGDASANRSKSNHAPGIPGDTTFWNGSFATGSGEVYGLSKVFCPADEYKGDFARAYFYIAACYGDSLVWEQEGEPGLAMTNAHWQEFRPWLRDLLVSWHRMDPVSEKEKARAIEVNKIQGNRNPFIDYPELVEYIWGNKQGQVVDFRTLTQSYGDEYGRAEGVCNTEEENQTARKEIRNGQIVILRNTSVFSILGQVIQ